MSMIIKRLGQAADTSAIYATIQNNEGATLNRGEVVEWDLDANVGSGVEEVDSATPQNVAGVVEDATIADTAEGLIQVYGLHDAVLTNTTLTAGAAASADTESSVGKAVDHSASTDLAANAALGIIGATLEVNDTNSAKIFLRCM